MNIAVYLGAKSGNKAIYAEKVKELGTFIAQNGHTLVYGGSNVGLMGILSDAVKDNGGKLIGVGVKVKKIIDAKRSDLDVYLETDNVQVRKKMMMDMSDMFVTIPGSLGTLDEVTDIMATLKLKIVSKPCFIYNINGFYNPLIAMLDNMCNEEFLSKSEIENVHFISSLDEMKSYIK